MFGYFSSKLLKRHSPPDRSGNSLVPKGFGSDVRGGDDRAGELFSYVDLEARVRRNHPLRAIRWRAGVSRRSAAVDCASTLIDAQSIRIKGRSSKVRSTREQDPAAQTRKSCSATSDAFRCLVDR
ncbi:hypothetical protein A9K65_031295 [Mesorhizobium sp. WSM1497]|nr:hypothetical protein A9K65_031295 [Mesorhizobium sp. WSM1497]PBC13123.1 hypothetical protein CK225_27720 [Mesorhizobium loti]